MKKIVDFLNQPYPEADDFMASIRGAVASGFIVFAVLALFAPFGLSENGADMYFHAAVFGLITVFTLFSIEVFFRYIIKLRRDVPEWTFWKWIVSILFLLSVIAAVNYLYARYQFGSSQNSFLGMMYSTFVVGIFPVTVFGSLNLIRKLKANQKIAEEVQVDSSISLASANVALPIKNSIKTFEIDPSKILFLESMQNYVLIHYLDEHDQLKKETHRNTITALSNALENSGIKRTHRSYLVNPKMIGSVSGNAQGLKLHLIQGESVVPVSRKYIDDFR